MNTSPTLKATTSVNAIIRKLGSRKAAIREQAEQALKELTPEQVDAFVRILRANVFAERMQIGRVERFGPFFIMMVPFFISLLTGMVFFGRRIFVPLELSAACAAILFSTRRVRFRKSIVQAAMLVRDAKLLGPLITISCTKSTKNKNKLYLWLGGYVHEYPVGTDENAVHAMSQILRRATPDDNMDVTRNEFERLTDTLRSEDAELVVRLLPMLETISNSVYVSYGLVLSAVRLLEKGQYSGEGNPVVREVARHCRTMIEARMAQNLIWGTLLRASQPTGQAETLVRAVEGNAPVEEAVLLRAGQGEES